MSNLNISAKCLGRSHKFRETPASENIFQESVCGEVCHRFFFFLFFFSRKLICSGTCVSACILILLIKIKNVQICLCGDRGVGKGKVNHAQHFLLSMLRILCTQALRVSPIGMQGSFCPSSVSRLWHSLRGR